MDYLRSERAQQHALLRAALLEHISTHPEALIVIEEYDKLDCATRGFFRQLLENARTANVTLDRYRPPNQITGVLLSTSGPMHSLIDPEGAAQAKLNAER